MSVCESRGFGVPSPFFASVSCNAAQSSRQLVAREARDRDCVPRPGLRIRHAGFVSIQSCSIANVSIAEIRDKTRFAITGANRAFRSTSSRTSRRFISTTRRCRQTGKTSRSIMRLVSVQLLAFSRCVLYRSNSAPTVSPLVARSAFFSSAGSAPSKIRPRCCVAALRASARRMSGIASQANSPDSAVVSVVERERLVASRRDPNREARHDGVEHFVPLPLRLQQIKISSGQVDGRHGSALPMFPAQEVVWGEPGVTPRRRFDAATRNHSHRALTSNPSTGRELRPNRRMQKIAGKRVDYGLGAGGRWFESSRPDHFTPGPF